MNIFNTVVHGVQAPRAASNSTSHEQPQNGHQRQNTPRGGADADTGALACTLCRRTFHSEESLFDHMGSPGHLAKLEDSPHTQPSTPRSAVAGGGVPAPRLECRLCARSFPNPAHLAGHLAGAQHKRRVLNRDMAALYENKLQVGIMHTKKMCRALKSKYEVAHLGPPMIDNQYVVLEKGIQEFRDRRASRVHLGHRPNLIPDLQCRPRTASHTLIYKQFLKKNTHVRQQTMWISVAGLAIGAVQVIVSELKDLHVDIEPPALPPPLTVMLRVINAGEEPQTLVSCRQLVPLPEVGLNGLLQGLIDWGRYITLNFAGRGYLLHLSA